MSGGGKSEFGRGGGQLRASEQHSRTERSPVVMRWSGSDEAERPGAVLGEVISSVTMFSYHVSS